MHYSGVSLVIEQRPGIFKSEQIFNAVNVSGEEAILVSELEALLQDFKTSNKY